MFSCVSAEFAPASALRLWQLISPASPVGAYAYSSGLESAVAEGWVASERALQEWIRGVLVNGLAVLDAPLLARSYDAWMRRDHGDLLRWAQFLRAARETAELQQEDRQLGSALARLLHGLGMEAAAPWRERPEVNYPCMFALAAVHWGIPCRTACEGYLWAWCENQVTAAMKLMPLGQTAGQRILGEAAADIPMAVSNALALSDQEIGQQLPGLALASALHETQYSRLFRS